MHICVYLIVGICFSALFGVLKAATTSKNDSSSGGWENAFSGNSSVIPLVQLGEKSYYFGIYYKATYLEADQFCTDIHMNLVTIQSAEEMDLINKYAQNSTKEEHFWTSGSKLLDLKNWIWMSTGEIVEYTKWGPGQPDNPTSELCLELWLYRNNGGFLYNDRSCTDRYAFICERSSRKPYVQRGSQNTQWPAVFQNPYVSPNINLLHFQGKSYYFGIYFKATYLQATQFCQMINMNLVSITSDDENNRIQKYIRDTNAGDSFWSSGSRAIDGKTWVWLSTGKFVEYTHWSSGQPDNINDLCIQLVHQRDSGLFWNDHGCTNQLFFICESFDSLWVSPGSVTVPPKTNSNGSTTESGTQVIYPDNPSLPQTTLNGKKYRVSKTRATQDKASDTCRQYGMELISIQNKGKNDIATNLIQQTGNNGTDNYYWTSARKQSNGKWIWGDLEPLTYTNWAAGEPNNATGVEYCLHLFYVGTWNDLRCDKELYFICESPNSECSSYCPSQPIVNVYVNNNQCSNGNNATITETKAVASSQGGSGYNVEINNNIDTCKTASTNTYTSTKKVESKKAKHNHQKN